MLFLFVIVLLSKLPLHFKGTGSGPEAFSRKKSWETYCKILSSEKWMFMWYRIDIVLTYPIVNYFRFFEYYIHRIVTLGNGLKWGLCRSQLEIHHVQWKPGFLAAASRERNCSVQVWISWLAYYKEFFSDWFMKIYCSLEIAHKLLAANIELKLSNYRSVLFTWSPKLQVIVLCFPTDWLQ